MPVEIRPFADFREEFPEYLRSIKGRTEATRRQRFLERLRDFFGIEAEELERTLKMGDHGARVSGRPDALAGNVILEFKKSLTPGELAGAKGQLLDYARALADAGDQHRYALIATDGDSFQPFVWVAGSAEVSASTNKVTLSGLGWREAYHWIDDWIASRFEQRQPANAATINRALGNNSPAFLQGFGILEASWMRAKNTQHAAYEWWTRSLLHVYGSNLSDEPLFLRHAYITTVAKVLVYAALRPAELQEKSRSDQEVRDILTGEVFRRYGVANLGEHDFFSWIADTPEGVQLARGFLDRCAGWDFENAPQDLFRGVYEELIDPATRKDLGEFYTPQWIAELMIDEALPDAHLTVLDPTCGSGTFLVAAVAKKLEQKETLPEILAEVTGIDIHPVAVTVARASYLLALRPLLLQRSGVGMRIELPVYLSNSVDPRQATFRPILGPTSGPAARIKVYGLTVTNELGLPEEITIPSGLLAGSHSEPILSALQDGIPLGAWASVEAITRRDLATLDPPELEATVLLIRMAFDAIHRLHKAGRNSIHIFLLRNYFRPSLLAGAFDRVVGNPPWLAFRYLKDKGVQTSIKAAYAQEKLLPPGGGSHITTVLDLSVLFFVRCGEVYLRPDGRIRFVMPRTIFGGDQYVGFRNLSHDLSFDKVWDLARVHPIFEHVQSCIVGAIRGPTGRTLRDPIPLEIWKGSLPSKAVSLREAKAVLSVEASSLLPAGQGSKWTYPGQDVALLEAGRSYYFSEAENGVIIAPYSLFFVDLDVDPTLGVDLSVPAIKTGQRALRQPKPPWDNISIRGAVESCFLFEAITGSEVLPYGHLPLPLAALPAIKKRSGGGFQVMDSSELRKGGYPGMAAFFEHGERIWAAQQGKGGKPGAGPLKEQVNYRQKLAKHPSDGTFLVTIPTSARMVLACVIREGAATHSESGVEVPVSGTILANTNNFVRARTKAEADYLCAFLNSGPVNRVTKPGTQRGIDTERHTHREALELPIPRFDPKDDAHIRLAELGGKCAGEVESLLSNDLAALVQTAFIPKKLADLRAEIKKRLEPLEREVDSLVTELLAPTNRRRSRDPERLPAPDE